MLAFAQFLWSKPGIILIALVLLSSMTAYSYSLKNEVTKKDVVISNMKGDITKANKEAIEIRSKAKTDQINAISVAVRKERDLINNLSAESDILTARVRGLNDSKNIAAESIIVTVNSMLKHARDIDSSKER